jgi:hypothetical protein
METRGLKIPAYLTGFSSKSDGSAGIRFATQEIDGETFKLLKDLNQSFGWLLFGPQEQEIPSEKVGMSPSERLRRRMFVYFKAKKLEGDFDTWRKQQLEAVGQRYLDKLD